MNKLIRAAFLPHDPRLLTEWPKDGSAEEKALVEAMEQAAKELKEMNPQTVIIFNSQGLTVPDAVSISMHPRLRGMVGDEESGLSVAFETDVFLIRSILRKADRLGVNFVELTDDKAKSLRGTLELNEGAVVPLYVMHQAGFKGQIVHVASSNLPFEEVYTFGKAVQGAIEKIDKRVVILASGYLGPQKTEALTQEDSEKLECFKGKVFEAVEKYQVKDLLSLDRQEAEQWAPSAIRPLLFLMGVLGGKKGASRVLNYKKSEGQSLLVATLEG